MRRHYTLRAFWELWKSPGATIRLILDGGGDHNLKRHEINGHTILALPDEEPPVWGFISCWPFLNQTPEQSPLAA